jgi:hypothetical protein
MEEELGKSTEGWAGQKWVEKAAQDEEDKVGISVTCSQC